MALDAEELQARVALRAVWSPAKQELAGAHTTNGTNGASQDEAASSSLMHRRFRSEVEDTLRGGLLRRLARLERQVKVLCDSNGSRGVDDSQVVDEAVSTEPADADECDERALCESVAKALRRANRCATEPAKNYGPTEAQVKQVAPPEKDEALEKESVTLMASLQSLEQSLASRSRQIKNLQQQADACEKELAKQNEEAEDVLGQLALFQKDPSKLSAAKDFRMERKRRRAKQMRENARHQREQATHYEALVHQQRAFFLQRERIDAHGGKQEVQRHPAGEIFLVHQPISLDDDNTQEMFDVGTSVANPYVCDSWPFEPNVLSKRGPTEAFMQPFKEETEEDLEEENKPRNPFRAGLSSLRLPARGDSDDEDDYDGRYNGPSDTARSL